jgi:hypothetical protein
MPFREILLVVAIVLFGIGGFTYRADPNYPWSWRLMSAGLCFFAASFFPWPR